MSFLCCVRNKLNSDHEVRSIQEFLRDSPQNIERPVFHPYSRKSTSRAPSVVSQNLPSDRLSLLLHGRDLLTSECLETSFISSNWSGLEIGHLRRQSSSPSMGAWRAFSSIQRSPDLPTSLADAEINLRPVSLGGGDTVASLPHRSDLCVASSPVCGSVFDEAFSPVCRTVDQPTEDVGGPPSGPAKESPPATEPSPRAFMSTNSGLATEPVSLSLRNSTCGSDSLTSQAASPVSTRHGLGCISGCSAPLSSPCPTATARISVNVCSPCPTISQPGAYNSRQVTNNGIPSPCPSTATIELENSILAPTPLPYKPIADHFIKRVWTTEEET